MTHKHGSDRTEMENLCTQVFRSVFDFCPIRDGDKAGKKFRQRGSSIEADLWSVPDDLKEEKEIFPLRHDKVAGKIWV